MTPAKVQIVIEAVDKARNVLDHVRKELDGVRSAGGRLPGSLNQADRSMRKLQSSSVQLSSGLKRAAVAAGSLYAAIWAIRRVASVIGSILKPAMEMEQFEAEFEVILGSLDAAKSRMAELARFAAETPFQLPEVVRASRVLEVLTKGAISTGAGLKLVGDVSAGVGANIEELAMWFGRLYDGIQNGRPIGRAAMRLQELGALSGQARGKIEKLQKVGTDGAVVWEMVADEFDRFAGLMERKSQTLGGQMSNLSDNIFNLLATVGEQIRDTLTPAMLALNNALNDLVSASPSIAMLGDAMSDLFKIGIRLLEQLLGAGDHVTVLEKSLYGLTFVLQSVSLLLAVFTMGLKVVYGSIEQIAILIGRLPIITTEAIKGNFESASQLATQMWDDISAKSIKNAEDVAAAWEEALGWLRNVEPVIEIKKAAAPSTTGAPDGTGEDSEPTPELRFPDTREAATDRAWGGSRMGPKSGVQEQLNAYRDLDAFISGTLVASFQGISQAISGLITKSATWGEVMLAVGNRIVEMFVDMILQYTLFHVMRMLFDAIFHKTTQANVVTTAAVGTGAAVAQTATSEGLAATTATAWAPAAAATSVASWGVGAIIGVALAVAGIAAIIAAISGAFATGGMIPGSPSTKDNTLAMVATGEYIVAAPVVQRLGKGFFDAINFGGNVPPSSYQHGFSAGGAFVGPQNSASAQNVNVGFVNSRFEMKEFLAKSGWKIVADQMNRRTRRA